MNAILENASNNSEGGITSTELANTELITEGSANGFFAIDEKGNFTQANQIYCDLLGFTEAELVRLNILDVQASTSPEKRDTYLQQIMSLGSARFEDQHCHQNTSVFPINISAFYSHKDSQIFCFVQNHSEQAKIQEALNLASKVLARANDFVIVCEAEPISLPGPRIVYVNEAFSRVTGYSAQEVIGLTPRLLQGSKSDPTTMHRVRTALKTWQPIREEILYYKKNGEEFWCEIDITPVANELGWVTHWISIQRDITQRKLAEADTTKKQTELNMLNFAMSRANDCIMIAKDPSTSEHKKLEVIYVNQAFEEETGYQSEEVVGKSLRILRGPESNPATFDRINLAIKLKKAIREEVLNYRKNGEVFWTELDISPIMNGAGETTHWLSIQRNIEKRKATELVLETAKLKSEALSQLKNDFIANMSHEIRTPMNGIIGLSTLALNYPMSSEVRDYLTNIEAASNGLLRILNDILDFSKLESNAVQIENNPLNPQELLSDIYDLLFPSLTEKNLDFCINLDQKIPKKILGDALRIKQILLNLVGNALKFTPSGKVSINLIAANLLENSVRIRFEIKDSGSGFSPKDLNKLQLAFNQGDGSTTRRYGGIGLGLTISSQLLALMGSQLEIANNLQGGACVSFELDFKIPGRGFSENESPPSQKSKKITKTTNPMENTLLGKRILVAEDNRINLQVIKEFLKRAGAEVDTAVNGFEVLELMASNKYDAVLMDAQMPEMDGLEATKIIREAAQYDSLPIIAISAGASDEERADCAEVGMNDFMAKPINPNALIEILQRWL